MQVNIPARAQASYLRPVAPTSQPAWLQAINAARANLGHSPLTAAQLDGAWRNNNDQR